MDTRITDLASGQHALVTRRQMYGLGLTDSEIEHLLRSGRLRRVHPGVYLVPGSPPTWHQTLLAACLSLEGDALVSHRAAAALWGVSGPFGHVVEVTGGRNDRARPKSAVIHRSTDLSPEHATERFGVPVTKPARTLLDLGAVVSRPVLDQAVDDALAKKLVTYKGLLTILDELGRRGRRGVGKLRASLAERDGVPESVLEAALQRLISRCGLDRPVYQFVVNDPHGRFVARVDAAYPDLRIAIEADGVSTRMGRRALEHDTLRQNLLVGEGWIVLRFTWKQIVMEPEKVIAAVQAAITRRRHELGLSAVA